MVATSREVIKVNQDGSSVVKCTIYGTTVGTLPTTGDGIDGLLSTDTFAPGCVLLCPNDGTVAVTNSEGEFQTV